MMGVHDVGPSQRSQQTGRKWMGRMAAEGSERAQDADREASGLGHQRWTRPEGDELTLDVRRQGASQLQRISLAATEETGGSERSGDDVNDSHANG